MRQSCYVAGPMTGRPNFNFDAFDEVTAKLRDAGWEVVNPAERDRELYDTSAPGFVEGDVKRWSEATGFDYRLAMRYDLGVITRSDAIIFLPGWSSSTGAKHERYVGEVCGLEFFYAHRVEHGWIIDLAVDTEDQVID